MKPKSTKTVINESGIPPKLINAVVRQLGGKDSLEDIMNHGINGGFHGFIYYTDTVSFFKRNRKEIVELANRMADDLGENVIDMVAQFNCLRIDSARRNGTTDQQMTYELRKEMTELNASIGRCLYGRVTDEDTNVANALAWFAGEEVARAFCDY